jgi:hypothetical protein
MFAGLCIIYVFIASNAILEKNRPNQNGPKVIAPIAIWPKSHGLA